MRALDWPLQGRDADLARIRASLVETDTGGIVVAGAPGIGKTRLTRAALEQLDDRHVVQSVVATPGAATIPFGCLAHLMAEPSMSVVEPPELLNTLVRLRSQMVASAGERSLVVSVDDAHHLDDASATLLHQLAATRQARLVVTVRADAVIPEPVTALWKEEWCDRIDLDPLGRDDVAKLSAVTLGGPLDQESLTRLFTVSGGNPLFLRELLVDAVDGGIVTHHSGLWHWPGVAGGVRLRELIEAQLGQLDAEGQQLLDLLAVADALPSAVVSTLGHRLTLASLEHAGIVMVNAADDALVTVAHPLFREVRLAGLGPARVAELERLLVEAFSQVGSAGAEHRLRVAKWSLAVGGPVPVEQLREAARAAHHGGDLVLARSFAEAAQDQGGGPQADLELAEVLEPTDARRSRSLVEDLAEQLDDDEDRARALCCAIRVLAHGCREPEAAEQVAARASLVGDAVWRGYVDAQWASTLAMLGRYGEARPLSDALAEHPDVRVRLRALSAQNLVAVAEGQLDDALAATSALLPEALARRVGMPRAIYWLFSALTVDLLALGRLDDVDKLMELADAEPAASDPARGAYQRMVEARVLLSRGLVSDARSHATESAQLFTHSDGQGYRSVALGLLVEACALEGDASGAVEAATEATRLIAESEPRFHHLDTQRSCAWAAAAAGDAATAVAELVATADAARDQGNRLFEAHALFDATRLGAPRRIVERAAEVAARIQGPLAACWAGYAVSVASSDAAGLEHAGARLHTDGHLLLAAECFAAAARLHQQQGVASGARRAGRQLAMVRSHLDGVRSVSLEVSVDLPALSRREQQVAALAARGLTSRAIAEQLAVSKRTVDNQLSSVYDKLGITGRHELAEVLHLDG